jgi:hypothetical protein
VAAIGLTESFERLEKPMQHSLRRDAKLAALALMALSSVCAATEGAVAQSRKLAVAQPYRYIDGHVSFCDPRQSTITVKMYAAEHYDARPLLCGGAQVNGNMKPDFQIGKR